MKIGILTSSRADFGIYMPLLNKIKADNYFDLEIIAFGTHLSKFHGYTLKFIEEVGFKIIHTISSLITNDDENAISTAFGLTVLKFADFWSENKYDIVFCLGDRFEMCAAIQAGIPSGVIFAHIHGGETTLGAVDDIYRHQITLASQLHFPSTQAFAHRIQEIIGKKGNIYPVGSLSIEDIQSLDIPSEDEFRNKYNISGEFVLSTFHPETVSPEKNSDYSIEMLAGLKAVATKINLVITMPNADTFGTIFREALLKLKDEMPEKVFLIESFGKLNYFAAMTYCKVLLGNTSSGIIEAASFKKYVVNVGDRQKGRLQSENVLNCSFNATAIKDSVDLAIQKRSFLGKNIYYKEGTSNKIIDIVKKLQYA
jgi:GDP/UDP-N,N'-diacetylbacillosamine 2-epimerase (hydrolysing)